MTRIILIRHGESVANKQGLFAGHIDVDLTELGLRQAKATAEYVAENYKVDKAYASDLKRAYRTGKASADRLGVEIEASRQLREIYAGKWEGMVFNDLSKIYPHEFDLWYNDMGKAHCPDGESIVELYERVIAEINRIADANENKTVVVATHATPIRCVMTYILHGDVQKMTQVNWVTNASVTVVEIENGQWTLVSASEEGHLAGISTAFPENL